VSEPSSRDTRLERDPAERAADHAAIDRLTDELLPALIAKLQLSAARVADDFPA